MADLHAHAAVARATLGELVERYEAILFDAYGVLVDASGALPTAPAAISALVRYRVPFLVVTNDASRSPERAADRLNRLGMPVTPSHILSSGMLIGPALVERGLDRTRVVVLGTGDSAAYASAVGATVVDPDPEHPADVLVVADEGGFNLLDVMDDVLSMVLRGCERGQPPVLLLANPDLVYPSGPGAFGFTAGSLAGMLERALQLLVGEQAPRFVVLGKPAAMHFETALAQMGTRRAVMLGDTLHTDIAGAHGVGISSAIVLTGVTTEAQALAAGVHAPTYLLADLAG
jgi:HAD superfamily hydrolase (TIGR01450 family)